MAAGMEYPARPEAIGHEASGLLCPKRFSNAPLSFQMPCFACSIGLRLRSCRRPFLSIVDQRPSTQDTPPPFTSRQINPIPGMTMRKSISPWWPVCSLERPDRMEHRQEVFAGSVFNNSKTRFSDGGAVGWACGGIIRGMSHLRIREELPLDTFACGRIVPLEAIHPATWP